MPLTFSATSWRHARPQPGPSLNSLNKFDSSARAATMEIAHVMAIILIQTVDWRRLLTASLFSETLSLNNNTKQRFRDFREGRTDLRHGEA
jgi:hypothetical protein